jgi:hypothetical protein
MQRPVVRDSGAANLRCAVNGVNVMALVDLELASKKEAVAKLLQLPWSETIARDMDKLVTYLNEQDLITFRDVGELSDDVVGQMRQQRIAATVTVGTFANFVKLRGIFRTLSERQGKRRNVPSLIFNLIISSLSLSPISRDVSRARGRKSK